MTRIKTQRYPKPSKALGQNFLIHESTLNTLAEKICHNDPEILVELGAGTGNLTLALAQRCKRVIAFELDERLVHWHDKQQLLPDNVELRQADILRISYQALWEETGDRLHLAGNLPYNISTQVVFSMCAQRRFIKEAFFLFQKEVADRITSPPGKKDYGTISVVSQYCADVKKILEIPPSMFRPKPKVYSALVQFRFFQGEKPRCDDYEFFVKTVRASFSQRRKKIVNCLSSFFRLEKHLLEVVLNKADISPDIRAERLSVSHFVTLASGLKDIVKKKALPL